MKKTALFADVQNIYYTSRQIYARQFNYRKLWQWVSADSDIIRAYAYAIQRQDDQQIKFQDALRHIGFEVKLKPYILRSDGSSKGDWDVGISVDMLLTAKDVERIVLLSGDGDFDYLLHRIRRDHADIEIHVYGVRELTAKSLIEAATHFQPIEAELLL